MHRRSAFMASEYPRKTDAFSQLSYRTPATVEVSAGTSLNAAVAKHQQFDSR